MGVLGQGSMGEVRAAAPASDPSQTVVIKILCPDIADTPRAREFFERENRHTARLQHPYIVRLLDSGIDSELGPCLVLEFVPGHTLDQLLRVKPVIPLNRAARLIGCLCHGLSVAHATGVVHQDLKPANLMITNSDTPGEMLKIMDFGLARLSSKPYLSRERLSGHDVVIVRGTPAYISPEQVRCDDVDGTADIYATGVILYEMLTGMHPFPYSDPATVMNSHLKEVPPSFEQRGVRHLPASLETVVMRCLGKYAPERPRTPRELANEISRSIGIDVWEGMTPAMFSPSMDELPVAESVADSPAADPWQVIRMSEAWMPDQIAVLKLGGFMKDHRADLLHTEPGLLRARFHIIESRSLISRMFKSRKKEAIDLEVRMERPVRASNRILLTLNFLPSEGTIVPDRVEYLARCEYLYDQIRKYLM